MAPVASRLATEPTQGAVELRERTRRPDGLPLYWLLALAVWSLALTACAPPAPPAPEPTSTSSTPTATPDATGEEQASADPTHTPTPTASGQRDSGSDPKPTATPTPTPTPASDPEPSATTTPAATATEAFAAEPPLGDCFGGALSEDPLHCYVLEQAQARGLMDVVGIYDGDLWLYVSIRQDRVSPALARFAKEQTAAFFDSWPRLVPSDKYWRACAEAPLPWPDCFLWSVDNPMWDAEGYVLLPTSSFGDPLKLVMGGEAGWRELPGWASWRQLWPRVAAQGGTGKRGTDEGPAFDVSDVDVTNFPEIDCSVESLAYFPTGCYGWPDLQDVGFAGRHTAPGIVYYQMKNPPTDEAELKALKDRLVPCHDVIGECTYTHWSGETRTRYNTETRTIEIIIVKYDFGELWRWATILDRFARSAGNTLGILGAQVATNTRRPGSDRLYMNGVEWAGQNSGPVNNPLPADVRQTIVVKVRDVQRAADGLSALLPLLGIPADAVGFVIRWYD